jgi:hypothetical protein
MSGPLMLESSEALSLGQPSMFWHPWRLVASSATPHSHKHACLVSVDVYAEVKECVLAVVLGHWEALVDSMRFLPVGHAVRDVGSRVAVHIDGPLERIVRVEG